MRALLDTHVFLWALDDPAKLPKPILSLFKNDGTELFVSAASIWEIAIKHRLGKIKMPLVLPQYIKTRFDAFGIESLPVTVEHAAAVAALPNHHRDPFDRMLVVQAMMEDLTLATLNPIFARYNVRRVASR